MSKRGLYIGYTRFAMLFVQAGLLSGAWISPMHYGSTITSSSFTRFRDAPERMCRMAVISQ